MMMDLAWNKNALKAGCSNYLQNWLSSLFGDVTAKKIKPLMEEYYRLTSIRQPALYGHALRRYRVSFGRVRQ